MKTSTKRKCEREPEMNTITEMKNTPEGINKRLANAEEHDSNLKTG